MEPGEFVIRSRFGEGHGDMTIVDQSSARSFPAASIYNIRGFAEFVHAPMPISAPLLFAGVNAGWTYEYFLNFILEILAHTAINFPACRKANLQRTIDSRLLRRYGPLKGLR
jgi:hypothetical protein